MKKILLLLFIFTSISVNSQNYIIKNDTININNQVSLSGKLIKQSCKYQYAAVGCAVTGGIFAVIAANIKYKPSNPELYEVKDLNKNMKNGMYVIAGACGVAAICCEIISINLKMKAGKALEVCSDNGLASVKVYF